MSRAKHSNTYIKILISTVLVYVLISSVSAEELPLWELNVGVGSLSQAYYPGSSETRQFTFPVIYPTYRGDIFRSSRGNLSANFIDSDRFQLDVSLGFNFAIDSDDIALREGMPDIDSVVQIGPALEIELASSDVDRWEVNLPLRAAFAIGSDFESRGFTFAPNIAYYRYFDVAALPMKWGIAAGPQFGDARYHDTFYGVDAEYATATRSAYRTDSGYSGYRLSTSLSLRHNRSLWAIFAGYNNVSNATFVDSPLVDADDNFTIGFVFSYALFKSKTMVKNDIFDNQ